MSAWKNKPTLLAVVLALLLAAASCALWHWWGSAGGEDLGALERQAERYWNAEGLRVERTVQRGDYLAALCRGADGGYRLCVYDRDRLWHNRWRASGGKSALACGELSSWNYGSPRGEAVLVVCGCGLSEEVRGYSLQNGGVTYICPVDGDSVLDLFVIPDGRDDINGHPVPLDGAAMALRG